MRNRETKDLLADLTVQQVRLTARVTELLDEVSTLRVLQAHEQDASAPPVKRTRLGAPVVASALTPLLAPLEPMQVDTPPRSPRARS